jgi:hypothetical protein
LTDEFCSKESSLALSWRDRDDSFSELFDPSPVPASRQLQTPQVALSLEQHPVAVSCWTDILFPDIRVFKKNLAHHDILLQY